MWVCCLKRVHRIHSIQRRPLAALGVHVTVVLWFSKCMGIVPWVWYNGIPRNSIIPHEGYNPCTLENHNTADLYYDATTQTLGSVSLPQSLYFTMQLGCTKFLEYMGFVLAVFPLKYGFIMVQLSIPHLQDRTVSIIFQGYYRSHAQL